MANSVISGAAGPIGISLQPTITLLASFNGDNGQIPYGSLIADANGNLLGTTVYGGTYLSGTYYGDGTVFEITNTATGYASTPASVVEFNQADGEGPQGSLLADAAGDLFGTTSEGGASGNGTVFEIQNTATGYATAPVVLASFDGLGGILAPEGSLLADASGDLFGTASGGLSDDGGVFEIVSTPTGYAAPVALVSFDGTDGATPTGDLLADASGDLFGTTEYGGADGDGTVFEIQNTPTGYASTPLTLFSFDGTDGANPHGGLVADSYGDLFGTSAGIGPFAVGGPGNAGTVFEIVNTPTGYASAPITLLSFDGANGAYPQGSLLIDAEGNLFGTTADSGPSEGTVFEIQNTATGYAASPILLNGDPGQTDPQNAIIAPMGGLIADDNGDLFGLSAFGGTLNQGSVFEISNSGYATLPLPLIAGAEGSLTTSDTVPIDPFANVAIADPTMGQTETATVALSDPMNGTLAGPGGTYDASQGVYTFTGTPTSVAADLQNLLFTPAQHQVVPGTAVTTDLALTVTNAAGYVATDTTTSVAVTDTALPAGPTDFNGNGVDDVLFQNSASGLVLDWQLQNGTVVASNPIAGATPDWTLVGTGDFYGNNTSDVLFRNTSGLILDWQMQDGTLVSSVPIAGATPDWGLIGTADLYGNGTDDILFENNQTGLILDWQMQDGALVADHPIAGATFDWRFVGTGDLYGNGTDDILFENNQTGLILDWQMQNGTFVADHPVAGANPDWTLLGLGDFTGDGTDDILFQNVNSGQLLYWQIVNGTFAGGVMLGALPPGASVVGIGHYGPGSASDILVQDNGAISAWQLSHGAVASVEPLAGVAQGWNTI